MQLLLESDRWLIEKVGGAEESETTDLFQFLVRSMPDQHNEVLTAIRFRRLGIVEKGLIFR